MKAVVFAVGAVLALGACVKLIPASQSVTQVGKFEGREVCIVDNAAVQEGFREAMTRALVQRGYVVRSLPAGTPIAACPILATYVANWQWDLRRYMIYAEIRVYNQGRQAGLAVYDARRTFDQSKFINAEQKVIELVSNLFASS